jgi:hypothetical protein
MFVKKFVQYGSITLHELNLSETRYHLMKLGIISQDLQKLYGEKT